VQSQWWQLWDFNPTRDEWRWIGWVYTSPCLIRSTLFGEVAGHAGGDHWFVVQAGDGSFFEPTMCEA
jgi:hypothetical protein